MGCGTPHGNVEAWLLPALAPAAPLELAPAAPLELALAAPPELAPEPVPPTPYHRHPEVGKCKALARS